MKHYVAICNIVDGDVSAEVIATDFDGMLKEGEELASLHDQIVVKLPMIKEGVKAAKYFSDKGIVLKDPTPEEIKDMAIEMVDLIEKKWRPVEGDDELQEKVQNIFDQSINSDLFKSQVSKNLKINFTHVGKFRGKISTQFLRNNLEWLN